MKFCVLTTSKLGLLQTLNNMNMPGGLLLLLLHLCCAYIHSSVEEALLSIRKKGVKSLLCNITKTIPRTDSDAVEHGNT